MPQGTPAALTSEAVQRLEAGAKRVRRELLDETGLDYLRHVYASVGDQPRSSTAGPGASSRGSAGGHLGGVMIELAPAETRGLTSEEVGNRWREATGPYSRGGWPDIRLSLHSPQAMTSISCSRVVMSSSCGPPRTR